MQWRCHGFGHHCGIMHALQETDVILGDARQTMSCGQRCDISHVVTWSFDFVTRFDDWQDKARCLFDGVSFA